MLPFRDIFLKLFDELIAQGKNLPAGDYSSNVELSAILHGWQGRCLNLIGKTFGKESDYYVNLHRYFGLGNIEAHKAYGIKILENAKKDYEVLEPATTMQRMERGIEPLPFLERICSRFHLVVRQLRERHDGRPTLDVNDEYDVQDIMYVLLRINFEDIRKEEWAPSYAAGCSRMDFLLKREGIVLETKKTRGGLSAKDLADQLIVDIERYRTHPDCKMLFCFVYDPEGRIANPEGLEHDLTKVQENIAVRVLVTPKGK